MSRTHIETPQRSDEGLTSRQIRLVQTLADLQMALSAVSFMCELDDEEAITRVERRRLRCFEDAAVIAYGRAFSEAKGIPFLHWKHLEIKPTATQIALHDRLMERRRKVVAHSDSERQRIAFATNPVDDDLTIMIPHMDFDDALEFYADRLDLMSWLNHVHSAAAAVLFRQVQRRAPIRFIRDHTLNA